MFFARELSENCNFGLFDKTFCDVISSLSLFSMINTRCTNIVAGQNIFDCIWWLYIVSQTLFQSLKVVCLEKTPSLKKNSLFEKKWALWKKMDSLEKNGRFGKNGFFGEHDIFEKNGPFGKKWSLWKKWLLWNKIASLGTNGLYGKHGIFGKNGFLASFFANLISDCGLKISRSRSPGSVFGRKYAATELFCCTLRNFPTHPSSIFCPFRSRSQRKLGSGFWAERWKILV